MIEQTTNLDLKEIFCYPLGPVSWSITYSSGDMVKTSKSALMAELQKGATNVEQVPRH